MRVCRNWPRPSAGQTANVSLPIARQSFLQDMARKWLILHVGQVGNLPHLGPSSY